MSYKLRELTKADARDVISVFNFFIRDSMAAFREVEVGLTHFDKVWAGIEGLPAVAVETDNGEFVGFGHLKPYQAISTFRKTAEITFFILPDHTRQGIGTQMLDYLLDKARSMGVDSILASISSLNEQSRRFVSKHGFTEYGRFADIAIKNEQLFDVIWMVKKI